MKKNLFVCSLLVCGATMWSQTAAAAENWVGSWKLNAAKSSFGSGAVTRAETLKFEATATGIKLTSVGTDPLGKATRGEYTSMFDGKDVAWTGNASADMASPKRLDDNSYENVWKKNAKATMTAKVVVSADGKSLTVTQTPAGATEKNATSVAVYDRQ